MGLKVESVTFDCTDPEALAQWWSRAVNGEVSAVMPGEFILVRQPEGPNLAFQRVDDPTPGKNRAHVDFAVADVEAEVKRLVELGASETDRHSFGEDFRWVVLTDPAGNYFCVGAG